MTNLMITVRLSLSFEGLIEASYVRPGQNELSKQMENMIFQMINCQKKGQKII
jgi:hypothetical protein